MKKTDSVFIGERGRAKITQDARKRVDMALRILQAEDRIPTAEVVQETLQKMGYGMDRWILLGIMRDHRDHRKKKVGGFVNRYRRLPRFDRAILRKLLAAIDKEEGQG